MKKILGCIAILLLLPGCTTWSLQELRKAESKGNQFQTALAKDYLAFSENEAAEYDWIDSKHFAEKGLTAIYGTDVGPEDLADWSIPKDKLPDLEKARESLVAALTKDNMTGKPEVLARAQSKFDCWVEEQEEEWQLDEIKACREGFESAMGELKNVPKEAAQPLVGSTSYIVFFDFNKASLTEDGKKIIATVIADLKHAKEPYEIVLNGHADKSGADTYNMALSQKRVEAVKRELIKGGVPEKSINIFAFGETDPRIPTNNGVKEKANRRVEIFING